MKAEQELISVIDLTRLVEADSVQEIESLCAKAKQCEQRTGCHVAAICVFPEYIQTVKEQLVDSTVKIATVVNFPHGTDDIESIREQVSSALLQGADEIDLVFPYRDYLQGKKEQALAVVSVCDELCGDRLLKVILETGEVPLGNIKQMALDVIEHGADFIKSSTGKVKVGATKDAVQKMLEAIAESKAPIGLKVSGGVRTFDDAMLYLNLYKETMGVSDVTPNLFRIGASGLLDALV